MLISMALSEGLTYPIVGTGQSGCYDNMRKLAQAPRTGEAFYGQDAQTARNKPNYTVCANKLTVKDNITGLTWQRSPDTNDDGKLGLADKLTFDQAKKQPEKLNKAKFGGYTDWRLPSIKELYSLINFDGIDPNPMASDTSTLKPFIDTTAFVFQYGRQDEGERIIDSQYASSTLYVGPESWDGAKLFGVNFPDGRIKGYGLAMPGRGSKTFYVICVRGNEKYGINDFKDNGDGTVVDLATGLIWQKDDSKKAMNWLEALAWAEAKNKENYLGHNDWRLPNAKELQSIVDYTRLPAIPKAFSATKIKNEAGVADYPWYWSSTTHGQGGRAAVYVCFGRALGYMNGAWQDVHGAGSQRSDPKSGDPSQFPTGRGPQGDAIRIYNYAKLVRS